MSGINNFQSTIRKHGAPVSVGLIALMIFGFVSCWISPSLISTLGFFTQSATTQPWTFISYLLTVSPSTGSLLCLVFGCLWMWGIGAFIEREMGSKRLLVVLGIVALLSSVCLWLGSNIVNTPGYVLGAWILVSAVTVIWGTRHPTMPVTLMFVLPIQARWVAWISAGLVLFGTTPALAPFAVLPLVLVWAFAAEKLPIRYAPGFSPRSRGKKEERVRQGGTVKAGYFEDVKKREQEREERERLRKLFESSMIDNTDPERKAE